MIRILIICCLSLTSLQAISQAYFQQETNYEIKVKLDDKEHFLRGHIKIDYTNNSPDQLEFLWFHLWPNAYKDNNTAMAKQHSDDRDFDFHYAPDSLLGFIDSLTFTINGQTASIEYHPDHIDIAKLKLLKPLLPGEKISIETPFRVKVPSGEFSRLGHVGQSYQITQWYPKPAVYDRNGWHEMPYLTQGEFYSEFGSFDVEITLPKNYVVGATGDLQNQEEIDWLMKKAEITQNLIDKKISQTEMTFPASAKETKTIRYKQSNVHDFGWFADKRYNVLTDTVHLPHSGRAVRCWAMFTNNEWNLWKNSIEYLKDGTHYYSLWNGNYPYNQVTAVDGTISAGGGMEYPNVTVIGASGNKFILEVTIVHEVGHNWFYGILGSNERDHAWMDEGLNTLNENRYLETKYPDMKLTEGIFNVGDKISEAFGLDIFKNKSMYELGYLYSARTNYDQALELPSEEFTSINYGSMVYYKTGIIFDYLKAYLGNSLFDKCMQTYFERWKFKHPLPEDLRAVFEEITGKDLSWFFDDMIKTTKKIDHKILSVKETQWGDYQVKVKSKAEINGPFSIGGIQNDTIITYQWYDSVPENGKVTFPKGDYDKIMLDPYWETPEVTRKNNIIKTKGLCKKTEKLKFQFLGGIENPYQSTVYWAPVLGFNSHDGLMAGAAFYNSIIPRKKFEYVLMPMFGLRSNELTGFGSLAYNFPLKSKAVFQNFKTSINSQRFSQLSPLGFTVNYTKLEGKINMELKRKKLRFSPQQHIELRYLYLVNSDFWSNATSIAEIKYKFKRDKPFYFFGADVMARYGQNPGNNQMLYTELDLRGRFYYAGSKRKKINIRAYTGFFPYKGSNGIQNTWAATLSGQTGAYDYTYDQLYLGRSESRPDFLSQQMVFNHAGFKAYTPIVSDKWMTALNVMVDLPLSVVKLSVFADYGMFPVGLVTPDGISYSTDNAYDFGLKLQMFGGNLEFYVPLLYSDQFTQHYDFYQYNFWQKIRFTFHIKELNPFKLISGFGI